MNLPEDSRIKLEIISGFLLKCILVSLCFLLLWFFGFLMVKNIGFVERIHYSLFRVTPRDINLFNYWGMGIFKLAVFLIFVIPFISLKLILKKPAGK